MVRKKEKHEIHGQTQAAFLVLSVAVAFGSAFMVVFSMAYAG